MSPRRGALPRPRIVDVARAAGVSAQTVSNVLNDRPGFTDATRDRVLTAVREIGYTPDTAGRQLRTGETRRIAFSMTQEDLDPQNPFIVQFVQALVTTASEVDRRVIMLDHESEADGSFAADLAAREADGFILANSEPGDYRVALLEKFQVPYAIMGRTAPEQSQTWVDIDNAHAIGTAVDHVVERGHRSLAFAGYRTERDWLHERRRGMRERARYHGLIVPEDFILEDSSDGLVPRIRALFERDDPPTALVTASDSIGVRAINIAHALGLNVGRDLAITGFDGSALASMVMPTLTTVRIPIPAIAERLIHRLSDQIRHRPSNSTGEFIPTELVVGGST